MPSSVEFLSSIPEQIKVLFAHRVVVMTCKEEEAIWIESGFSTEPDHDGFDLMVDLVLSKAICDLINAFVQYILLNSTPWLEDGGVDQVMIPSVSRLGVFDNLQLLLKI